MSVPPVASIAAATAIPLSPAQRCHPDPLSVSLSFLDLAEWAVSDRVCRSWRAASQRNTAWPLLSDEQLSRLELDQSIPRCLYMDVRRGWMPKMPGESQMCRCLDQDRLLLAPAARFRIQALAVLSLPAAAAFMQHVLIQATALPLRFLALDQLDASDATVTECFRTLAPTLQVLHVSYYGSSILQRLPLLTNLQAMAISMTASEVAALCRAVHWMPRLHTLSLHINQWELEELLSHHYDPATFAQLLCAPSLRQLRLVGAWHMDDLTQLLSGASQLRLTHLCLPTSVRMKEKWASAPRQACAHQVPRLELLQHLEVRHLVDNAFLLSACKLQQLCHMDVTLAEPISLTCVQVLAALPHFESLQLRSCSTHSPAFFPDAFMLHAMTSSVQWRSLTYIADARTMQLLQHHLRLLQGKLDAQTLSGLQSFHLLLEPEGSLERSYHRFSSVASSDVADDGVPVHQRKRNHAAVEDFTASAALILPTNDSLHPFAVKRSQAGAH